MYRSLSFSLSKSAVLASAPKPSPSSSTLSSASAARPLSSAASSVPDPDDQSSTDPILHNLEEFIHRIIVRRSAPDWLPFLPGSSYWVPPRQSGASSRGLVQALERLARPVPDLESLPVASSRGWPSPEFFIHGARPEEMAAKASSDKAEEGIGLSQFSESEDDEG